MANDTTQRDVNAEFRQSKVQQMNRADDKAAWLKGEMDAGNLAAIGENRYRVLNGWDRGEVFTVNFDLLGAAQVLANHGLDTKENGGVAAYFKDTPAWWDLDGTNVIKGGSSSVKTVLNMAGLDWETILTPQEGTNPITGERDTIPDAFHTRRGDTGAVLGSVGKIYHPISNAEAFGFLDDLFGDNLMVCESAGSFRGGKRVFITAELPTELLIDPDGFKDHIRQYIAIINTHDGSTPFIAVATPWRVECGNTERLALRQAVAKFSIRHTKNYRDRMNEARKTLGLTTAYYEEFATEQAALVQTPFAANQIDALCADIWGEIKEDAPKSVATKNEKRRDTMHELFRFESERCGANAYAAERSVTAYVDHFAELRPRGALKGNRLAASAVAILEGTTDEVKTRAHKKLMTLTNR